MKDLGKEFVLIMLCLSLLFMPTNNATQDTNLQMNEMNLDQTSDHIVIDGNDDLKKQARLNNWDLDGTRDGTPERPFYIEGLTFAGLSGTAFEIKNTNLHVWIESLTIAGENITSQGMYLENVHHALIRYVHIYDMAPGGMAITIKKCEDVRVVFGTFDGYATQGDVKQGISIYDSLYTNIVSCSFFNSYNPVLVSNSNRTVIETSEFIDNYNTHIYLQSSSRVSVQNNWISGPAGVGVYLQNAERNWIRSNSIHEATPGISTYQSSQYNSIYANNITQAESYGIYMGDQSYSNYLYGNNVSANAQYGIMMATGSSSNWAEWNNLLGNAVGQAFDNGTTNIFNYNYFSDMTGSDLNSDMFYDSGYTLLGDAANNDPAPLVVQHELTLPEIIYPYLLTNFDGTIPIEWSPAKSNYQTDFTYRILSRPNNEYTSQVVATDIVGTTYSDFDVSNLPYGKYRLVVITRLNNTFSLSDGSKPFWIKTHELLPFNVNTPNGGEELSGPHTIIWEDCIDPLSYQVYYHVYLSTDSGASWNGIAFDLNTTLFTFDFSTVAVGTTNLIKVRAFNELGLEYSDTSDNLFSVVQDDTNNTTDPTDDFTESPSDSDTVPEDTDGGEPTLDFTYAPDVAVLLFAFLVTLPIYWHRRKQ